MHRKLAAGKIQRLDTIGALVELGNPGITHELLHAVLTYVAVATEHLHTQIRNFAAKVSKEAFDHRGQQRNQVFGTLSNLRIGMHFGVVDLQAQPGSKGSRALVVRLPNQQHTSDVRVDDDRVSRPIDVLGTGR